MIVTHGYNIPNHSFKILSPIAIEYNAREWKPDVALEKLKTKADEINGNAIIGFRWNALSSGEEELGINMMVQGTAVIAFVNNKNNN